MNFLKWLTCDKPDSDEAKGKARINTMNKLFLKKVEVLKFNDHCCQTDSKLIIQSNDFLISNIDADFSGNFFDVKITLFIGGVKYIEFKPTPNFVSFNLFNKYEILLKSGVNASIAVEYLEPLDSQLYVSPFDSELYVLINGEEIRNIY